VAKWQNADKGDQPKAEQNNTHTSKKNNIVDLNRQIQNQRKGIEKAGYNNCKKRSLSSETEY